ncbi:MAG: CZB domain-containing protein [Campylobacterota bacterium]|nr:CZB domain-containing protein [Campylobacterota bacterium]
MTIFKIHHIIFKSEAYATTINGTCKNDCLTKDHHECAFGQWYDHTGMGLFKGNTHFKQISLHHKNIHDLINQNIHYIKANGMVTYEDREIIINRFRDAENETQSLFSTMDTLSDELGGNVNFSNE